MSEAEALAALLDGGFVRREGDRVRTTPRWQAALARAALTLQRTRAPWTGIALPVTLALAEAYRALDDEALAALVQVMLPIEERELEGAWGTPPVG